VEAVEVEEGDGMRDTEDIVDLHLHIIAEEVGEDTRDPDHVNVNTAHEGVIKHSQLKKHVNVFKRQVHGWNGSCLMHWYINGKFSYICFRMSVLTSLGAYLNAFNSRI